jgi:hypothetical protein
VKRHRDRDRREQNGGQGRPGYAHPHRHPRFPLLPPTRQASDTLCSTMAAPIGAGLQASGLPELGASFEGEMGRACPRQADYP